ncbi:MAG: metallophosphoesterase [Bacteroidales bacterium]|nr:metallophosphoesterase [Bacteroidales bacterium]
MKSFVTINLTGLFLLSFISCSDNFSYSPYDSDVDKDHPNEEQVKMISNIALSGSDTFKFALLSDIHDNYDDLSDAIKRLNKHTDLSFIACCGDITNSGLAQQFEWYVDVINKSQHPFISLIGNHDYRSNGYRIYQKVFGPSDFSFDAGNYKFVFFDNVVWENDNRSPKFDWLTDQLSDSELPHVILTHIPPWDNQMTGINNLVFRDIVNSENTILCCHGHTHEYADTCYNGVHTIVSEAINDREYYVISLVGKQSFFKRIRY